MENFSDEETFFRIRATVLIADVDILLFYNWCCSALIGLMYLQYVQLRLEDGDDLDPLRFKVSVPRFRGNLSLPSFPPVFFRRTKCFLRQLVARLQAFLAGRSVKSNSG